jgi:phosphoribosyl-ATP pyrophosphohydrolase
MGERTEGIVDGNLGETLDRLVAIVKGRRQASPAKSYTARLLTEPEDYLYKKVVEEATELVLAAKDADHDHVRYEAADLLYHLVVLMERTGITPAELAGELNARMP